MVIGIYCVKGSLQSFLKTSLCFCYVGVWFVSVFLFLCFRYLPALEEHGRLAFLSASFALALCLFVLWLHLEDPAPACLSASAPLSHLVHSSFINWHSPLTTDYESMMLKNKQKHVFFFNKKHSSLLY